MTHAITIGGLLLSIGVLAGIVIAAYGAISAYANMMADAAGDNGKKGCTVFAVGAVLIIVCIAGLVL